MADLYQFSTFEPTDDGNAGMMSFNHRLPRFNFGILMGHIALVGVRVL